MAPVAEDGHATLGYLRKPPGDGPFPAVVLVHGGLIEYPPDTLRDTALGAYPSRFLEAGYVTAVVTYRSRVEPYFEGQPSLTDVRAAVDSVRDLPFVDRRSVVVNGCSSGGDLALRLASGADLPAVVAEEPAPLMTHLVTQDLLDRFMGGETVDLVALHRAAGGSEVLRESIDRIDTPILLVQGDGQSVENSFNAEFLIPDLEAAGKDLRVASFAGPHCFAFGGTSPAAAEAFATVDAYIKERVAVQPMPLDPALVSRVPAGESPEREAIEVSAAVLAEYVGRYRLPKGLAGFPPDVAPTMVVTLDGGRLHVEVLEGSLGKVPFAAQSDTFFFSPQGWIMEFVEDDTGTVTGLFWDRGFLAPRL
jgi:dienelactone hydrolase